MIFVKMSTCSLSVCVTQSSFSVKLRRGDFSLRGREGLIVVERRKRRGSYRSGGIALINGVFEVCAKLIKCDDLKK